MIPGPELVMSAANVPPRACLSFFMWPQTCVDLRTGRDARATSEGTNVLQAAMQVAVAFAVFFSSFKKSLKSYSFFFCLNSQS